MHVIFILLVVWIAVIVLTRIARAIVTGLLVLVAIARRSCLLKAGAEYKKAADRRKYGSLGPASEVRRPAAE